MTIRKIISVLVFSLMALIYVPAHANMDFAMGMATGVSTGSSMSMLGAQIHNNLEDDSETTQQDQQTSPQPQDRFVMKMFAVIMMIFSLFLLVMILNLML